MKGRFWKETLAACLALAIVTGNVPVQPFTQCFERTAVTASATFPDARAIYVNNPEHGTISISSENVGEYSNGTLFSTENQKISFTVTPDANYVVKSVSVNNGAVNVTKNADGTYSFTMPNDSVTISAVFEKVIDSGSCGTDGHESEVTWTLTQNNDDNDNPTYTLTISGTGAMKDYSSRDDRPWNSYSENITAVEIADGVTGIGNSAFYRCENLTTVTISGDLDSIGLSAFDYCTSLTTVTISGDVGSIGYSAFGQCTSLTTVTIPGDVGSIGFGAFDGCEKLSTVTISGDVGSIGEGAFSNCEILTSFSLCAKNPPSVKNSSFNWSSPEIKFYVPVSSISNYRSANIWSSHQQLIKEKFYVVTLPKNTTGGKIKADKRCIDKDDFSDNSRTVTLTPVPEEGYALDSLTVKNSSGYDVPFNKNSDGTYTFTMYYDDVTVEAKFGKIVATVGETGYTSLDTAIRAANADSGDVVVLNTDINEPTLSLGLYYGSGYYDKNITLDLNNHTVTCGTIYTAGSLTIKNGILNCPVNNVNYYSDTALTVDKAILNVSDRLEWGGDNITVINGATLDIKNESFIPTGGGKDFSLFIDDTSSVILNNGSVPGSYNDNLIQEQFGRYLPNGYSFEYDEDTYVYYLADSNGEKVTYPVTLGMHKNVIDAASVTLGGELGLNFYIKVPADVAATGAKVVMTGPEGKKTVELSGQTPLSTGGYKITYPIKAINMAHKVKLQILDSSGNVLDIYGHDLGAIANNTFEYGIYDYVTAAKADTTLPAKTQTMVNAMYTYGAYSEYWKHKTTLPDDVGNLPDISEEGFTDYSPVITAPETNDITLKSLSLVLDSNTALRLYFTCNDITGHSAKYKVGDSEKTLDIVPTSTANEYYVEISNISAKNLKTKYTIEFDNGLTVEASAMSYVYLSLRNNTAEEDVRNVIRALTAYSNAADNYNTN